MSELSRWQCHIGRLGGPASGWRFARKSGDTRESADIYEAVFVERGGRGFWSGRCFRTCPSASGGWHIRLHAGGARGGDRSRPARRRRQPGATMPQEVRGHHAYFRLAALLRTSGPPCTTREPEPVSPAGREFSRPTRPRAAPSHVPTPESHSSHRFHWPETRPTHSSAMLGPSEQDSTATRARSPWGYGREGRPACGRNTRTSYAHAARPDRRIRKPRREAAFLERLPLCVTGHSPPLLRAAPSRGVRCNACRWCAAALRRGKRRHAEADATRPASRTRLQPARSPHFYVRTLPQTRDPPPIPPQSAHPRPSAAISVPSPPTSGFFRHSPPELLRPESSRILPAWPARAIFVPISPPRTESVSMTRGWVKQD